VLAEREAIALGLALQRIFLAAGEALALLLFLGTVAIAALLVVIDPKGHGAPPEKRMRKGPAPTGTGPRKS
jgi:hypothetical protein